MCDLRFVHERAYVDDERLHAEKICFEWLLGANDRTIWNGKRDSIAGVEGGPGRGCKAWLFGAYVCYGKYIRIGIKHGCSVIRVGPQPRSGISPGLKLHVHVGVIAVSLYSMIENASRLPKVRITLFYRARHELYVRAPER
jgi:hypothetical protein